MAKQKKDFSLIAWVFGWLLALVTAIKKIAARLEVPFEAFDRLGSPEGEATIEKIVRVIHDDWLAEQPKQTASQGGHPYRCVSLSGNALPKDHYCVYVSYAPMPSMDDLKKKWGKDNVSDLFDGRPFSPHASCVGMDRTPCEQVFYVHDAGGDWEGEEQIAWGEKQRSAIAPKGYRPATNEEIYEFARTHPELVDFVGLGSFAMNVRNRCVTGVWLHDGQRILGGGWSGLRFDRRVRVLFVSK